MPTKVFAGNLPEDCTAKELRDLFGPHGEISELDIIKNYAFVHFVKEDDAKNAVRSLDKTKLRGQDLQVQMSKNQTVSRENRPPPRRDQRPLLLPGGQRSEPGPTHNAGAPQHFGSPGHGMHPVRPSGTAAVSGASPGISGGYPDNRLPVRESPDPDVRVRREAVPVRVAPNAEKLGLSSGYVIYERYYVDPGHPLLRGLPLPQLPRMTDSYAVREIPQQRKPDAYETFDRRPPEPQPYPVPGNYYNSGGAYRDRSPVGQRDSYQSEYHEQVHEPYYERDRRDMY